MSEKPIDREDEATLAGAGAVVMGAQERTKDYLKLSYVNLY
jgi:hypothetical protein